MITIKDKAIQMYKELGVCAIEQGYSITMNNKIYLDLIMIMFFKKIMKKKLNINDKTFKEVMIYGNRR